MTTLASYWARRANHRFRFQHVSFVLHGYLEVLCKVNPGKGPTPADFDYPTNAMEAYAVYPPARFSVCHSCSFWWRTLLIADETLVTKFYVYDSWNHPERLDKLLKDRHAREIIEEWQNLWNVAPWPMVKP